MMPNNRLRLIIAFCAGALALTAVRAIAAADTPRIGVVVTTRVNVPDSESDEVSQSLADHMQEQLDVEAVGGIFVRRRLPPGGVKDDCVARRKCVSDLATRLDADQLVFLFMVRVGSRLQIDSTWVDVRTRATVSRPALVVEQGGPPMGEVLAAAPRRLLPNATVRVAAAPAPAPTLVVTPVKPVVRGRHITTPAVIAGAVAGLALIGGVGLALSARNDFAEMEREDCDIRVCPDIDDRVQRMENKALAADILFGAAAAAAVTGAILYATSGGTEQAPPVEVGTTGDGAVVSVGGRF